MIVPGVDGSKDPRRQLLDLEGFVGEDLGDRIRLNSRPSAIANTLTSDLATRNGVSDGELIQTSGYSYANDGGGAWFRFAKGVSAGEDDGNKINCANGQWQRVRYGMVATAKSWNIYGVSDDTAAFENMCGAQFKKNDGRQGEKAQLEPGQTAILTETILLDPSVHEADCSILGCVGSPTLSEAPRILWKGASGKPVFAVGTRGFTFRGLMMFPHVGYEATTWIDQQFLPSGTGYTRLRVQDCWIGPAGGGAWCDYCITTHMFGPPGPVTNLDYGLVERCTLVCREACVLLDKGQPYQWILRDCLFTSENGPTPICGRGVWIRVPSCSVSIENPGFGPLSMALAMDTSAEVSVSGMTDVEHAKCLIGTGDGNFALGGGAGIGAPITWIGGRFEPASYNLASSNPTIAANNHTYIYLPRGHSVLSLKGCLFDAGGVYLPDWRGISVGSIVAENCIFPNEQPLGVYPQASRAARLFTPGSMGRRASAGPSGETHDELRYYTGTVSPSQGSVVIADAATFADVSWTQAEQYPPHVKVDIITETGAPAAGAYTYTVPQANRTTTGFRVTLGAAPGAGTSVRVLWEISPRAP